MAQEFCEQHVFFLFLLQYYITNEIFVPFINHAAALAQVPTVLLVKSPKYRRVLHGTCEDGNSGKKDAQQIYVDYTLAVVTHIRRIYLLPAQ